MTILDTFAKQTYVAQEHQRSKREQVAQNSAKEASYRTEHRTTGTGQISVKTPILFDCTFIERPHFGFGPEIVKLDQDLQHWRYPLANAGVWSWVTEPTPQARAEKAPLLNEAMRAASASGMASGVNSLDNSSIYGDDELLYKGAYVYFVITVDPVFRPASDGSDLAYLQGQLSTASGDNATRLQHLIAQSQEALWLTAHPPKPVMNFSLTFVGMALKTVPESVHDSLHADVTPRTAGRP